MQLWRRWAQRQDRPLAVDLFSGCGGMSLGLEEAGYAVILSVDNDPWALETHRHNMPGIALDLDLSDPARIDSLVGLLSGLSIDLVAAGPPCQPFSRAGRSKLRSLVEEGTRGVHDRRAELWQAFLEIVERVRPGSVLMENVPDLALGDDLALLRVISERLEKSGYDVESRLLDAWRYGVPQHRQRLILVGSRDGRPFEWPHPSGRRVTLRDAIADLPRLGKGTGESQMKTAGRLPAGSFRARARKGMNGDKVLWDHVTRAVRDDDREAFKLLRPGTRYSELPEHLRRYSIEKFDDKYNRLPWDDLCRSITAHIAKDGYWYIHPEEHRTLSVREAARIQTFPDHFRFAGSRSHAFRQIGNAVPPELARAVGAELLGAAKRKVLPKADRRSSWIFRVRAALLEWAERDGATAPWRHPADPWATVAGVLLGDRVGAKDEAVRAFLTRFPRLSRSTAVQIEEGCRKPGARETKSIKHLARLARSLEDRPCDWENTDWVRLSGLGPQQEALVRLIGLAEERLVPTRASLRVVARLTGSRVDSERRLSDGRMALGQLVGVEPGIPRLNAALHAFGRVVCTSAAPLCGTCPVARLCATAIARRG